MRFLLTLLAAMVASLGLGVGSAWYLIAAPHVGTETVGAWRSLPTVDAETASPYTRARVARIGELGMGTGLGLTFTAVGDDGGRRLDGRCDYAIEGVSPTARLWTLVATDGNGRAATTPGGRTAVDSRTALRDGAGRFTVTAAASARPGNWLPVPAGGGFTLTLRLYDTPAAASADRLPVLPAIVRKDCP